MKKVIREYILGFIMAYLIVCLIALVIYLGFAGLVLLFTWNIKGEFITEWNDVWISLQGLRVVNGIAVIIGIIGGFLNQ